MNGKEHFIPMENKKGVGVIILLLDNVNFTMKNIRRDKEGQYIMINGVIYQEEKTINLYAPNTREPSYMRQLLINLLGDTDANTIIAGDFNTH